MKLPRMMITLPIFVFLLLSGSFAQDHPTVNGRITFKGDGVPITNAKVWLHEESAGEMISVPVENSAKFHFSGDGYYDLVVTAPGFTPYVRKLWLHNGAHLDIEVKLKYDYENAQAD